jgi:hypothetical protein
MNTIYRLRTIMVTSMPVFEIDSDNSGKSLFTEFLYKHYPYDALDFEIDAIKKMMTFLEQLYPNKSVAEIERMHRILRIQTISKFCHCSENLAAFAISFLSTYDDIEKEMAGVSDKIVKYNVGQIVDFYSNIHKRNTEYIAKLFGYPPLDLQSQKPKYFLELSCKNLKEALVKIGNNYMEDHEPYNAYKHGYRMFIGKNTINLSIDLFPFLDQDGKRKVIQIDKKIITGVFKLSRYALQILEKIIKQHKIRSEYEAQQDHASRVNVTLCLTPNDPIPTQEERRIRYPSRRKRLKIEKAQSDIIYDLFREELEKKDKGKIIAIDLDEKTIVGKDYKLENVIETINNLNASSRIHLRRAGKNARVGIEVY